MSLVLVVDIIVSCPLEVGCVFAVCCRPMVTCQLKICECICRACLSLVLGCVNCMRCQLLQSVFLSSVSLPIEWLRCADVAERVEVLEPLGDPTNIVLDGGSDAASVKLLRPDVATD